jgi:vacuolar-type H+-ATPase subunit D/Vma8
MTNDMKQKLKMLKKIIKESLLKDELDSLAKGANTLTSKMINLEARIINIERDNEDLKLALGNLSVAYLELIKILPTFQNKDATKKFTEDDNLEKLLSAFNSEQNDDDLIN